MSVETMNARVMPPAIQAKLRRLCNARTWPVAGSAPKRDEPGPANARLEAEFRAIRKTMVYSAATPSEKRLDRKANAERISRLHALKVKGHDRPAFKPGESLTPKPSERRPEAANVIWKSFISDGESLIVAVAQPYHDESGVERSRFYVTMAYELVMPTRTDEDLEVLNRDYTVGVPIKFKSARGWRVIEPVSEFHGPFDSADEAIECTERWAQAASDEWRDFGGRSYEAEAS